jgi:hypothetical protein
VCSTRVVDLFTTEATDVVASAWERITKTKNQPFRSEMGNPLPFCGHGNQPPTATLFGYLSWLAPSQLPRTRPRPRALTPARPGLPHRSAAVCTGSCDREARCSACRLSARGGRRRLRRACFALGRAAGVVGARARIARCGRW